MKEKVSVKAKAHIRYKLADGTRVPGVTTLTSQLGWSREALVNWANRLGLEGVNCRQYKDDKADIGTLAHAMVVAHLRKEEVDTSDYSKNQIDQADNSFLSFLEWEKNHPITELILTETPLVSEKLRFGGTADIYGVVNGGKRTLIDLKTGNGIYLEMKIQVCAYEQLLIENGYPVDEVWILNIPRSEDESFIEELVGKKEDYFEVFLHCIGLYNLQKKLKGGNKWKS